MEIVHEIAVIICLRMFIDYIHPSCVYILLLEEMDLKETLYMETDPSSG